MKKSFALQIEAVLTYARSCANQCARTLKTLDVILQAPLSESVGQWGIAFLSRPFAKTDSLSTLFLSTLNRNTADLEAL